MTKQTLEYLIARFRLNEEGAVATEYGLLLVLIALAIIIAATALGGQIAAVFDRGVAALK
jgi:pilus assembly protein Flp/PilA